MMRMAPPRSVHHADHVAIVFAEGNQPVLAVVAARVVGHDDRAAKDFSRFAKADAVLTLVGCVLGDVPLEFHGSVTTNRDFSRALYCRTYHEQFKGID